MRKNFRLVIGAAVIVSIAAQSLSAADQLVPRLIVVRESGNPCPDFEADDAHLFLVGGSADLGSIPFGAQDPTEIALAISANLGGEITAEELLEFSEIVASELDGAALQFQETLLVTERGVESPLILWNARYPSYAAARAGADGEIICLGEFYGEKVDTTSDPGCELNGECGKWRITTLPTAAVVDRFCLSIGWFQR